VTEKFSYYDLLAYLVPGTLVMWVVIQAAEALDILQFASIGSTLLDASAFVVTAFLAGHLIQAEAQRRLDRPDKSPIFPQGLPSYSFLVADQKDENGNPWCSEAQRVDYVKAALRRGLLNEDGAALLGAPSGEGDALERAKQASHEIYRAGLSYLTDEGRAQKAVVANQTYGLFRGLTMAYTVCSVLFSMILLVGLIRAWAILPDLLVTWAGFTELILYPVVVMLLFFYAAWSFKLRARNRGKHHIREVFDALLASPVSATEHPKS